MLAQTLDARDHIEILVDGCPVAIGAAAHEVPTSVHCPKEVDAGASRKPVSATMARDPIVPSGLFVWISHVPPRRRAMKVMMPFSPGLVAPAGTASQATATSAAATTRIRPLFTAPTLGGPMAFD
jgi:hypothetical protein